MKDFTVLVIAHRLSTVANADRILCVVLLRTLLHASSWEESAHMYRSNHGWGSVFQSWTAPASSVQAMRS